MIVYFMYEILHVTESVSESMCMLDIIHQLVPVENSNFDALSRVIQSFTGCVNSYLLVILHIKGQRIYTFRTKKGP